MSFAIWNEKPPFTFGRNDPEQIYRVGDKWVVTDDPARATQQEVDAVLDAPPPPPKPTIDDVIAVLATPQQKAQIDAAAGARAASEVSVMAEK